VVPKSKASIREIDLSPTLKLELRQYSLAGATTEEIVSGRPRMGLVFAQASGKPMDPNGFLRRQFARAVAAAGLGDLRLHDLRHTFGSMKIEQGEKCSAPGGTVPFR
jgi:integrase